MKRIIPKMNGQIIMSEATFTIPQFVTTGGQFPKTDAVFCDRLKHMGNYTLMMAEKAVITYTQEEQMAVGAYRMTIREDGVNVFAEGEPGYSNALVTLYQVLAMNNGTISCCMVEDAPKFEHRGFMLDAARHFINADEVKRIIEQCALLKINRFHWHLSNDQGFRIESKKFPRLNTVGSYRKLAPIDPLVSEGQNVTGDIYGEYYTQEEIREIVSYAAARQIEIFPELSLPGHTTAVLASYQEYSCNGEPLEVSGIYGMHHRILCAGKESVYKFLFELIDEICDLFPSPYFHIGGDEAPKTYWRNCPDCNRVMKENGYNSYEQLQAHFVARLIEHLKSRGKTTIVFNEAMMSGKLDENAIVHYWLEMLPGESYAFPEAAKGRKFVLSSMYDFYWDYSHADTTLKSTYTYIPNLKGNSIPENSVLGVEAMIWTEWIVSNEDLEFMIYPRLAALAESAWTHEREYDDFVKRLEGYLQVKEINVLNGAALEQATIHGQAALDMIVEKSLELSMRYAHMSNYVEEIPTESGNLEHKKPQIDKVMMVKAMIETKMKNSYSEEEIKQVQNRILDSMGLNRKS